MISSASTGPFSSPRLDSLLRNATTQIKQEDIDLGNVVNSAVAGAVEPDGTPVDGSGSHLLLLPRTSEIDLGRRCDATHRSKTQ